MKLDTSGTREELTTSLSRVWGTFVEGLEYRFDLFALELKSEKQRATRIMLAMELAVMALFMAFLSLNAFLIITFWENRIAVVGSLLAFYTAVGLLLLWRIFASINNAPPPFRATIGELRKDYESWRVER